MAQQAPRWPDIASILAAPDEDDQSFIGQARALINRALDLFLAPFRLAVSRSARKFYLTSIFFFVASTALLTVASVAYSIFYYNYIPQISLDKVIHLQFSDDAPPYGITSLSPPTVLTTNQAYDVSIILHLPRTASNLAAGNFMVDLKLLSSTSGTIITKSQPFSSLLSLNDDTVLSHSRRPAILPQPTHTILSTFDTFFLRLPWTLFSWPWYSAKTTSLLTLESDHLEVPMFEEITFAPGRESTIPHFARLELQTLRHVQGLQVYSAEIHFHAKFSGLKYIVYNFRIISFLVFTSVFYTISVATMSSAWFLISIMSWIRNSEETKPSKVKSISSDQSSNGRVVKAEAADNESLQSIPPFGKGSVSESNRQLSRSKRSGITPSPARQIKSERRDSVDPLDDDEPSSSTNISTTNEELQPGDIPDDKFEVESDRNFDSGLGTSIAGGTGDTADEPTIPSGAASNTQEWSGEQSTRGRSTGRSGGYDEEEEPERNIGLGKRRSRVFEG